MKQTIEIFIYNSFQQFLKIELKRLFISHNFLNSSRYLTSPYRHHPYVFISTLKLLVCTDVFVCYPYLYN